jgi:hypothetical protein
VKKTPHGNRDGFEPQRESPFMKTEKAPPKKNIQRSRPSLNDNFFLCAILTMLVVLASSTSGDQ